jgi:hypothetical protein
MRGGKAQFLASNKNVTWSLGVPSNAGSISNQGLYTAPKQRCSNTVKATRISDPSLHASKARKVVKNVD